MPYYNFATYADTREEWAISADSIDHARSLIGDDPNGDWLSYAFRLDAETVECRDDFYNDDGGLPAIEEIAPDHWAWRAAHEAQIARSLHKNIAAIAGDFHTHRLYGAFYDAFGRLIDGFTGAYDLCIAMAEALTEWEIANGLGEAYENAGVLWIEVVEDFVETVLEMAVESGTLPDPQSVLPAIRGLAGGRE